ncbi:hypothetical protein PIN31009_03886 [Pandoraea iniqua]|uniref:hypothetical protein n=1 Tax=Pandoraea iniqua TaxID=2508288 RepID=UPI001240D594|nr:hypothetical protein [Pandoraea iniqua]VVE36316.1 hypothetical protein PIN31009_03886 [Pandoraea iniqua]
MKTCAYCNVANVKFTREHVWPDNIIEKCESLLTYNPKHENFYKGDPIVKDVCGSCNNNHLSKIDDYLASLFDKYFASYIESGQSAKFSYDYNFLLRGLLKISYNSARTTDNEKQRKLLAKFARQVLHGGAFTSVMVRLQIVTKSKAVTLMGNELGVLRPDVLRCGVVAYDGRLGNRFCIRLVGFRSYWFYVIIPYKIEPKHIWMELVSNLERWVTPMGVLVNPIENNLTIPVDKTTWFTPTLLGNLARDFKS